MIKNVICIIIATLFNLTTVYALEATLNENSSIKFIEEDTADCSIAEGKLITIQNTDPTKSYQVWVDRWFMDVQTPDHTKQILLPNTTPTPLGCSIARAGGKQHWTIYSVKAVE